MLERRSRSMGSLARQPLLLTGPSRVAANCFEIYVAPDPILDSLPDVSDVLGDDRALARQLAGLLDEKMQTFFQSMGESMPDFGGRDREVLALAVEKMEAAHHQMREEHAHQVKMLQRRLSKVTDSLTETEGIIRRGLSQKEIDSGVASIYRHRSGALGRRERPGTQERDDVQNFRG